MIFISIILIIFVDIIKENVNFIQSSNDNNRWIIIDDIENNFSEGKELSHVD